MPSPVLQGGVPLLIPGGGSVVPALADDPCGCCGGVPCDRCIGGVAPATATMTISGLTEAPLDKCNGSWVLPTLYPTEICSWYQQFFLEPCGPCKRPPGPGVDICFVLSLTCQLTTKQVGVNTYQNVMFFDVALVAPPNDTFLGWQGEMLLPGVGALGSTPPLSCPGTYTATTTSNFALNCIDFPEPWFYSETDEEPTVQVTL